MAVLLTLGRLREGLELGPTATTVGPTQLAAYAHITGQESGDAVPPGLAGVLARRAYLAGCDMPPGGVMLGQDLRFHRPVPAEVELTLAARVERVGERGGKPYVELRSTVSHGGTLLIEVVTRARWPEEETT